MLHVSKFIIIFKIPTHKGVISPVSAQKAWFDLRRCLTRNYLTATQATIIMKTPTSVKLEKSAFYFTTGLKTCRILVFFRFVFPIDIPVCVLPETYYLVEEFEQYNVCLHTRSE